MLLSENLSPADAADLTHSPLVATLAHNRFLLQPVLLLHVQPIVVMPEVAAAGAALTL